MSSGKWTQLGVPRKGWQFQSMEDLGEPSETCEMCETQTIRYVHYMTHPDYEGVLGVGCVCAEHMEENYTAPKERENQLRQRAPRLAKWMQRNWRLSKSGNQFYNHMGFNIVLYLTMNGWAYRITNRETGEARRKNGFPTQDRAKQSSFDCFEEMRSQSRHR